MGEPVKIVDLAKNMIKLSGFKIEDIGIEYSGIRPGEKLFEELLDEDEIHPDQIYPKIYIGKANTNKNKVILNEVNELFCNGEIRIEEIEIKDTLLNLIKKEKKND